VQHLTLPALMALLAREGAEMGEADSSWAEHPPAVLVPPWHWFSMRGFSRAGLKSVEPKSWVSVPFCASGCLLELCCCLPCEPGKLGHCWEVGQPSGGWMGIERGKTRGGGSRLLF